MWEANGQDREVAMYVRALVVAERPKAATSTRTLVRQYEESLGLSLVGLAARRWVIDPDDTPAVMAPTGTETPSAKSRLRLING